MMYRCKLCTYESDQRRHLKRHMTVHTGEKPNSCPHCPYRTARRDQLQKHIANNHNGTYPVKGQSLGEARGQSESGRRESESWSSVRASWGAVRERVGEQ